MSKLWVPKPFHRHNRLIHQEKNSEDGLIVAGQPDRHVNIEIRRPVCRVPGGQIGQWAPPTVCQENSAFDKNHDGEEFRPAKRAIPRDKRQRDDTSSDKRPYNSVQHLNCGQHRDFILIGFVLNCNPQQTEARLASLPRKVWPDEVPFQVPY